MISKVTLDVVFAAIVIVVLPVRAWLRHRRKTPKSPAALYVLETSLLTITLIWLLWQHGVPPRAIGVRSFMTLQFMIDMAVCLAVVIGLDLFSLCWATRHIQSPRIATPENSGVFTDALVGGRALVLFFPVAIIGAIWEELCFRGVVFLLVPRTLSGIVLGIVSGSLLFGIQHLRNGITGVAYSCFYGVVFSCLYLATRDLVTVVVAHAAGNIFATLYGAPRVARMQQEALRRATIFLG
jgi:uncharacterized protein